MADHEEELTGEQIGRQDEVDNAIYNLVTELVPEEYRAKLPVEGIAWNIEWISALRERIEGVIFDALKLPPSERDAFELAYYPYIVLEETAEAETA